MNLSKRIKNILLLGRCIGRAFFCGQANRLPKRVARIIVMPAGKLGDVVCTTPVLSALRNNFPEAQIIVGGNASLHRALLADSNLADEYLDLCGDEDAIDRIEQCRADVALVAGPSFETTAPLYLSGIPLVVAPKVIGGFSPNETRPYKVLQWFVKTYPYRMGAYAPRERLRALEPLGIICDDTRKHLGFSKAADKKIAAFFIHHGIDLQKDFVVGISPAAGNKIKEWPTERFAEVADSLIQKHHARVVLIGGPDDEPRVQDVLKNMKNPESVVNTQGQCSLDELKALVAKLRLFISVDTGPIYIAEAFGVPTIDIVGPVDERVQPPRGRIHKNVIPPHRTHAELSILNARVYDKEEALRQVRSITVSAVEKEIDSLISNLI